MCLWIEETILDAELIVLLLLSIGWSLVGDEWLGRPCALKVNTIGLNNGQSCLTRGAVFVYSGRLAYERFMIKSLHWEKASLVRRNVDFIRLDIRVWLHTKCFVFPTGDLANTGRNVHQWMQFWKSSLTLFWLCMRKVNLGLIWRRRWCSKFTKRKWVLSQLWFRDSRLKEPTEQSRILTLTVDSPSQQCVSLFPSGGQHFF